MYTVKRKLTLRLQLLFIVHSDIICLIWISYKEIFGISLRKTDVEIHNIKCIYIIYTTIISTLYRFYM